MMITMTNENVDYCDYDDNGDYDEEGDYGDLHDCGDNDNNDYGATRIMIMDSIW